MKQNMKEAIGLSLKRYNDTYMKAANDRIDNIVSQAGTDNTEIVDARIDSAGVTHTTLNNRILAETKMNDEQLVEYTGSNISAEDTTQGYLKDVEILGNTIQDEEDLADIRSVGDKVEGQELYEIPVLSCGKNLFDSTFEIGGIFWATGKDNNSEIDRVRTGYIRVKPNTEYIISEKNLLLYSVSHVFYLNKNKEFISLAQPSNGTPKISFSTPSDCFYIRLLRMGQGTSTDIYTQLEEGTVATPYEPYQEDKLTILSPVQLEKVGDVADRLIEKDGVWGVEKNVGTTIIQENVWGARNVNSNGLMRFATTLSVDIFQITNNTIKANILTNRYNVVSQADCYYLTNNGFSLEMNSKNLWFTSEVFTTVSEVSEYFKNNPTLVKYQLATPQFIPLPHDQQVKLRTFANKTNISFLTEIEGTIKAQVPKSLGATVNTHTEQINNLNKELDRVKKLEESTVSTVETESDFTTVEATSSGYFEDVKLEGKTLVNIANFTTNASTDSRILWSNNNCKLVDGEVTLVNKSNKTIGIDIYGTTGEWDSYHEIDAGKCLIMSLNASIKVGNLIGDFNKGWTSNDMNTLKESFIILEGDHTQNPPNGYIEGLKSVGQSTSEDGTDEIVVLSVKGDGNLFDCEVVNGFINADTGVEDNDVNQWAKTKSFIRVSPSTKYCISSKKTSTYFNAVIYYDSNRQCIGSNFSLNENNYALITTPHNAQYIKLRFRNYSGNSAILSDIQECLVIKSISEQPYTPYQSDKKRLLFYNNETQTWEKPVLREWDSIEKHSDGNYYYHQRSAEVVLNGSEDWNSDSNSSTISPPTYRQSIRFNSINIPNSTFDTNISSNLISDLLPSVRFSNTFNNNHIGISIYGTGNIGTHIVINNGFENATELKQWLQTNNITVVYQLAEEKVYECTNIDLITYSEETNYIVECGAISPKTTLKVHNNISNVVSLLQKKVSLLESNMTKYMITQNRMQLASTYSADSVTFKVDYTLCSEEVEYNEDLYNLILNNILVGKDNYDYDKMFTMILDYASWNQISWEQFDILVGLMDMQHNPPVEEIPTEDEVIEETPNEIM